MGYFGLKHDFLPHFCSLKTGNVELKDRFRLQNNLNNCYWIKHFVMELAFGEGTF